MRTFGPRPAVAVALLAAVVACTNETHDGGFVRSAADTSVAKIAGRPVSGGASSVLAGAPAPGQCTSTDATEHGSRSEAAPGIAAPTDRAPDETSSRDLSLLLALVAAALIARRKLTGAAP